MASVTPSATASDRSSDHGSDHGESAKTSRSGSKSAYTDYKYHDSASPCSSWTIDGGDDDVGSDLFPADTPWVAGATATVAAPLTAENLARLQALGQRCGTEVTSSGAEGIDGTCTPFADAARLEAALRLCGPSMKERRTVYVADHLWSPCPKRRGQWPCECRNDHAAPTATLHRRMLAAAEPGLALRRVVPHGAVPALLLWWGDGSGVVAQFLSPVDICWETAAELHAASPALNLGSTDRTDARISHAAAGLARLGGPSPAMTAADLRRSTVTAAGVAALARAVPRLRCLRLSLCRSLARDGGCAATAAAQFPSLVDLDLSESRPASLRPLAAVATLRRLRLCHNDGRVDTRGVPECLAVDLPLLTQLRSLFMTGHIETPPAVWAAVAALPLLELRATLALEQSPSPQPELPVTLTHLTVELAPGASDGLLVDIMGSGRRWSCGVDFSQLLVATPELQHLVVWGSLNNHWAPDAKDSHLMAGLRCVPRLETLKVFHCEPLMTRKEVLLTLPPDTTPTLREVWCTYNRCAQMRFAAGPGVATHTVERLPEAIAAAESVEPCVPELRWAWPQPDASSQASDSDSE